MTPAPQSARIEMGGGVTLERAVPFTLSDGTTLISDHYYPPNSDGQQNPTLLMRQPYGRDIASTVVYAHPAWFARHGYNVVIQDVRGRGGSGGHFYPFRNEARDGAETIAWLRTRPESNGRIGMYGFSYQGATQLLAAAEQPPGLQCIAPAMTACDLYAGWFHHNGALRLASSLGWGIQMLKEDARRLNLHEASARLETAWANIRTQATHLPYAQHPSITAPELPSYVRDWFAHPTPGPFWTDMDVSLRTSNINIPALHLSGWYDTYLDASIRGFDLLRRKAGSAHAREHQYLLAGPWSHIPWSNRVGEANFGDEALLDTDALLLLWFDHWLRDGGAWPCKTKVHHFVMGPNKWEEASDWQATEVHTLFLHSYGRAESLPANGVLDDFAPEKIESPDIFIYDPEVPVHAPGGPQSLPGPFDQSILEAGNNLLCYTSAPLSEPLQILGAPSVTLFATTSAPNADFTAKLIRLLPSGRADFLCIGIARSTHLFPDTYAADTIHRWQFDLEPTSCLFAPGERIRLEVAASAFPLYDRNPGTLTPAADMTPFTWQRSTHILHHSAEYPSTLNLPVIP